MRPINKDRVNKVFESIKGGKTYNEISSILSISSATIISYVKKFGDEEIEMIVRDRLIQSQFKLENKFAKRDEQKIKEIINSGGCITDVAHEFNVSCYVAKKWIGICHCLEKAIDNSRIKSRPRKEITTEGEKLLKKIVDSGGCIEDVAREFDVSGPTAKKWIVSCGCGYFEKAISNSVKKKSHVKVTKKDVKIMLKMSSGGFGIDFIGSKMGFSGTTVRRYLIEELGEEKYKSVHNIKKYTEQWSGHYYVNKFGEKFQSSYEEIVANFLRSKDVEYELHPDSIIIDGVRIFPDMKLKLSGTYIEVFGMMDRDFYKEKAYQKMKLYRDNNISCIFIFKEDLGVLPDAIERGLLNE